MARVVPRVPELSEVLCSSCGYVLDGLPETGVCPECGQPIARSLDSHRVPPAWESTLPSSSAAAFWATTLQIICRPGRFYRTLTVRGPLQPARSFARYHWWIAGGLFGLSGATHMVWFWYHVEGRPPDLFGVEWAIFTGLWVLLTALTYIALDLTTRIAAKLTNMEATYRGLRLPYAVVLRGLYFHAAHYLPVATASFITVGGYQLLLATHVTSGESAVKYLYIIAGQVVLSAIYLFQTYWIGMRNMMYANR